MNVTTLQVLLQFMYLYIDTKFPCLSTPMLKTFVKIYYKSFMVCLTYVETQLSQVISSHPILVQKSHVKSYNYS
jgi:hypothetical protein